MQSDEIVILLTFFVKESIVVLLLYLFVSKLRQAVYKIKELEIKTHLLIEYSQKDKELCKPLISEEKQDRILSDTRIKRVVNVFENKLEIFKDEVKRNISNSAMNVRQEVCLFTLRDSTTNKMIVKDICCYMKKERTFVVLYDYTDSLLIKVLYCSRKALYNPFVDKRDLVYQIGRTDSDRTSWKKFFEKLYYNTDFEKYGEYGIKYVEYLMTTYLTICVLRLREYHSLCDLEEIYKFTICKKLFKIPIIFHYTATEIPVFRYPDIKYRTDTFSVSDNAWEDWCE